MSQRKRAKHSPVNGTPRCRCCREVLDGSGRGQLCILCLEVFQRCHEIHATNSAQVSRMSKVNRIYRAQKVEMEMTRIARELAQQGEE